MGTLTYDPGCEWIRTFGGMEWKLINPYPILHVEEGDEVAKEYYEFDTDTSELKPMKKEKKQRKPILEGVDKWKLAKQVVSTVASGCATIALSRYLKANMPETENIVEKAVMGIGMYFITGVAGSMAAKYAEQEMDSWRDSMMADKDIPKLEESEE